MKAVFFDLDGTIFDTLDDITAAINYALRVYDGEEATKEEVRGYVGKGLRRALSLAVAAKHPNGIVDEEEFSLMFTVMMNYYIHHPVVHTKAYDGIPELLSDLKKGRVKLGIVSNKRNEIVQEIVSALLPDTIVTALLPDTFDYVSGEVAGYPLKPDPTLLVSALKKVGSSPAEALYVGDSEVDAETGRRAGIRTFIVSYGFRTEAELRESGIENTINNVETLSEKLKNEMNI